MCAHVRVCVCVIQESEEIKRRMGEFPGGTAVRTPCFNGRSPGSIPHQGTKIPQACSVAKK